MSFKRDIIVVNEFTVKRNGRGTKGSTPGKFVTRYMARDNATELVTPVTKHNIDTFVTRYMARDNATEVASDLTDLGQKMKHAQGLGGRGFGYQGNNTMPDPSMSDEAIKSVSKQIQAAYDQGKTVYKTVISFDGNFLKRNHIVNQDIPLQNNGHAYEKYAFAGKLDQMKLRLAIINGLRAMANRRVDGHKRFDDLVYAGVIQVDTKQVHCHLAMVDQGKGREVVLPNGQVEQKGELNDADKQTLRRGINNSLYEYEPIKQLTTKITRERQDTRSYVKRYTQKLIKEASFGQVLLAYLPDDKRQWRYGSNSKEMKKANQMVVNYVKGLWEKPESGYQEVSENISRYAAQRQEREQLSNSDYRKLIKQGQERLLESCVNGVYNVVKNVPETEKVASSKLLDDLAIDDQELAARHEQPPEDPVVEFTFHLRNYTNRLKKHRGEAEKYENRQLEFKQAQRAGQTDPAALAMLQFYNEEVDYHHQLESKYQLMMPFLSRNEAWKKAEKEYREKRDRLRRLQALQADNHTDSMTGEEAEQYGIEHYGLYGGKFKRNYPEVFDTRVEQLAVEVADSEDNLRNKLLLDNKHLEFDKGEPVIKKGNPYHFSDVKALDLHELLLDFNDDNLVISANNKQKFLKQAQERTKAYAGAVQYALNTDQPQIIAEIDTADIKAMSDFANKLAGNDVINLPKKTEEIPVKIRPKKVVSADYNLTPEINETIVKTTKDATPDELLLDNGNESLD